jgi:beta-lactam-binding protein with PASTA domain
VPDEVGKRLDVAESDLGDAGLTYQEIGGGALGIIVRSNWTVCQTEPAAGSTVGSGRSVKLIVARSC